MTTEYLLANVDRALGLRPRRTCRRRNVSGLNAINGCSANHLTPEPRKMLDQPAGGVTPPEPPAGLSHVEAPPNPGLILCPSPWFTFPVPMECA